MGSLSLIKGEKISLSKTDPSLEEVGIGLGWDVRATSGKAFDLDASALLLTRNAQGEEKVRSDNDFVFYGQLADVLIDRVSNKRPDEARASVIHEGDNRTGEGDGDDERMRVFLSRVPQDVHKIIITVSIYEEGVSTQNFGDVTNAFIRVCNEKTGQEIAKYDLSEDYSTETALIFGELYRHNGEWKFGAVGQGFNGGLEEIAKRYGVDL